jgi:hypothetical protein
MLHSVQAWLLACIWEPQLHADTSTNKDGM